MCKKVPISELIKLDINWVRGDDARFKSIFNSLKAGNRISDPIHLINCGCGKTYILEDGGHRISAAHKFFKKTGKDILVPVHTFVSDVL